jgi:hypothetical protein
MSLFFSLILPWAKPKYVEYVGIEVKGIISCTVQGIGTYDVLNQSDQPSHFGHLSHLDSAYE